MMSSTFFFTAPSTHHDGLSPQDWCVSVSSCRFRQCVCSSDPD